MKWSPYARRLWTHPAPERTTFRGDHVNRYRPSLQSGPVPATAPPIWVGGESEATLGIVKDLAGRLGDITRGAAMSARREQG